MLYGLFCDWFVIVSWFNYMYYVDSLVGGVIE